MDSHEKNNAEGHSREALSEHCFSYRGKTYSYVTGLEMTLILIKSKGGWYRESLYSCIMSESFNFHNVPA